MARELILACPYVYFWFARPDSTQRGTVIAGLFGGLAAVLVARALSHHKVFSLVMTVVAMLVFGLPRIYMGIHYPSDIAAGALVGLVCAFFAGLPALMPVWTGVGRLELRCAPLFYTASFLLLAEVSQMFDGLRNLVRFARAAI